METVENSTFWSQFDWDAIWPALAAIGVILAFVPVAGLYLTYIERKLSAAVQDRLGPNRVGPFGLFQAIADGIKIFLKEQVIPNHVHRFLYLLAPTVSLMTAMFALVVLPFGPVPADYDGGFRFVVAPGIDIALLMMFAISSLSAYGIILGGWASNNKYALYGAIRSCAQFISYEIPLGLSILGIVAFAGTLNIETIVASQGARHDAWWEGIIHWNIWWQPLALLIFFTAALAETNRLPFDLPECEQELVGGFHTEYGGIKFVLFALAEYIHVVTVSFLTVLLFFGGWHFPGLEGAGDGSLAANLIRTAVLLGKVACVIAFIMLLRWALPRFRFDQLMALAWKGLIPLGLLNLFAVIVTLTFDWPRWPLAVLAVVLLLAAGAINVAQIRGQIRRTHAAALGPSMT